MPSSPGSAPHMHSSPPPKFLGKLYDAFIWGISPHPGAVASLSEFDPTPGDPTDALRHMSLDGTSSCKAKRILSVCVPNGISQSRFVKDAPREKGTLDEGPWPRMVSLCGEERIIGKDEWDLYKMSERYKCFVRREPHLSTITSIVSVPESPDSNRVRNSQDSPFRKRQTHFKPPPGIARRVMSEQKKNEKRRLAHLPDLNDFDYESSSDEEEENDEADEDEVNDMVDDSIPPTPTPKQYLNSEKIKLAREKKEEDRKKRRERNRQKHQMQQEGDTANGDAYPCPWADVDFNFAKHQQRSKSMGPTTSHEGQKTPNMKRKEPESDSANDDDVPRNSKLYEKADGTRRHRTMSPKAAKKAMDALYKEQRRRRMEGKQKREKSRKDARERDFLKPIYEEAAKAKAEPSTNTYRSNEYEPSPDYVEDTTMAEEPFSSDNESNGDEPYEVDEEAIRRAALEESIRKIQELEKDRPLWEEAARKRRVAEEAEERERQEAKRQQELARQREREAEERRQREEAARKAREEAERQRGSETAKADMERRRHQLRSNLLRKVSAIRSTHRGRWMNVDAVAWYREQCDVFDKTKFRAADAVIVFEAIPWPSLHIPGEYNPEAVDSESTEKFFQAARLHLTSKEYATCVAKSAVRFHPDRWTAKGVLDSLEDRDLAERFKAAATRAAKTINNINSSLHA